MRHQAITATVKRYGYTAAELAELLSVDPTAIYHKLAGRRRWNLEEAAIIFEDIRSHRDSAVSLEQVIGLQPFPPAPELDELSGENKDSDEQLVEAEG